MDQAKIGRFIAEKRRALGLTQRELAEALGVSNRTVSKWECGGGLPELANILPLCALLDVTADELLRGEAEAEGE
ncbi:MAG: helix-turn-helix transcriptional regulator [Oscillospiraceae bacterium]|nr:helix-turn-helix transcriptional regulator [Oscillospiraceae bacterium]